MLYKVTPVRCLALMTALLLASCTSDLTRSGQDNGPVIYPPPPDTTRIQYLTSISSSQEIAGQQSAFNRFLFGEVTPLTVTKPYGITVRNSRIYVCDTGIGGLIIIDLEQNKMDLFIPEGKGQLMFPINCHVDDEGFLYVADGNRRQIVVFDDGGNYVSAFGGQEGFKPTDVALFENKVFVSSVTDQRIFVYSKDSLNLVRSFPEAEAGDPEYLYQPVNIEVNGDEIYVSDMGDFKIKVFSHDGRYLRSVSGYGNSYGQLTRPKGIAVDREKNLYIADAAFENVQIFDKDGRLLMFFGGHYTRPGDMWLPAGVAIDYDNLQYFSDYVDESFDLQYLIFVTNQYGPDKISVYGFVKPAK